MEKVVYVLWRDPKVEQETFAQTLRTEIADRLLSQGVHGLQINVVDAAVSAASKLYHVYTRPQMEAVIHAWIDSAIPVFRQPVDDIIARGASRFAAYLVTESQPIRNTRHVPQAGRRTYGLAQIAFGSRPAHIPYEAWLEKWLVGHTRIAMSSQPLFSYQQNAITRVLTPGAPPFDNVVEECFPEEAMTDPYVFFDAVGDEEKYKKNYNAIVDSAKSFVEFDKIDVFPTSQYVVKPLSRP